jgi:uncharacterized protein (TIGR02118 family)
MSFRAAGKALIALVPSSSAGVIKSASLRRLTGTVQVTHMAMSGWLLHSDPASPASDEMPESMHKITVQYFDPADGDDFETAYRERHVPLVQAVPGLERFTISLPQADGAPYLVAELWFADGDALSTAQTSAEMAAVRADSATYAVARRVIFAGSVEDV